MLPNFVHDVQAMLPLILLFAVAASLTTFLLLRGRKVSVRRAAIRACGSGALTVHVFAVMIATRIADALAGAGDTDATRQAVLTPLRSIRSYLESGLSATAVLEIGGNVLLLLPLGLLVPLAMGRNPGWRAILLLGLSASVVIEVMQWALAVGVASTDDVLLNVSGVALGYLAYLGCRRLRLRRRHAPPDSFRGLA